MLMRQMSRSSSILSPGWRMRVLKAAVVVVVVVVLAPIVFGMAGIGMDRGCT